MKYTILGDSDCPMVHIQLNPQETIKIERGAMAYSCNVQLEGRTNSNKKGLSGLFSAVGRSLTSGESMFITHATGTGNPAYIGVAPSAPGKITKLSLDQDHQYRLNTGTFLACDEQVNYRMVSQDLGKAIFSGTGGLFVMETYGQGDILISCFGDLIPLTVTPEHPLTIDNEHVVAWDSSLQYHIEIASGTFGFVSGEGLVNVFRGSGTVWIQTRNLHSLANSLLPFMPASNS